MSVSSWILATSFRSYVPQLTLNRLEDVYPTIGVAVAQAPSNADVHVCHKLQRTSSGSRTWIADDLGAEGLPRVFALYSGKFTTARLAARSCLDMVLAAEWGPNVQRQPYAQPGPLPFTVAASNQQLRWK